MITYLAEGNDLGLLVHLLKGLGLILGYICTWFLIKTFKDKLPQDQGRKFAVDGQKSVGKARGAGLIFVLVFAVLAFLFGEFSLEHIIYLVCLVLSMFTGYFDDASEKPWNEYKKGFLDLLIAGGITADYIYFNGTTVNLAVIGTSFTIPVWLFAILSVALIWIAINVTNCTDGVDGLSASLTIVTLLSFVAFGIVNGSNRSLSLGGIDYSVGLFIMTLLAYLLFNANPSTVLMGDAGSRAMGTLIAIVALKSGDPFIYIPFSLVMILDGGLGIIKISLKRFLKIWILKNTLTPLHDEARKNRGFSATQVVFRFTIYQIVVSMIALWMVNIF